MVSKANDLSVDTSLVSFEADHFRLHALVYMYIMFLFRFLIAFHTC